jgi:hypothetical protein
MACPRCLEQYRKDVWMVDVTIGPPDRIVHLKYECRVCGYVVPLTIEEIAAADIAEGIGM